MTKVPEIGSKWICKSNGIANYTVIAVTGNYPTHPICVVYQGENEKYWVRLLSDWYDKMEEQETPKPTFTAFHSRGSRSYEMPRIPTYKEIEEFTEYKFSNMPLRPNPSEEAWMNICKDRFEESQTENSIKAKTDKLGIGLTLIPLHSLFRLGKIFIEGLRYGKDNWKKGVNDKEYQEERLEHALRHLFLWKEGDRSEDHLAKVTWFCVTQMELERLEKENQ